MRMSIINRNIWFEGGKHLSRGYFPQIKQTHLKARIEKTLKKSFRTWGTTTAVDGRYLPTILSWFLRFSSVFCTLNCFKMLVEVLTGFVTDDGDFPSDPIKTQTEFLELSRHDARTPKVSSPEWASRETTGEVLKCKNVYTS